MRVERVMNRVCSNRIISILLLLFTSMCTVAEMRSWTLVDGTTFEADYIVTIGGRATLKLPAGKTIKVSMDQFIAEDQTHIELENPPDLKTDFRKINDQKVFHLIAGLPDYTQRMPEDRYHYGVRIKQVGGQPYKHELRAEFFAIGTELTGQRLILLDHQDTGTFLLNKQNEVTFEFLSEREVVLRSWSVLNEVRQRGRKYYGYLILIRDTRGEIVTADYSHKWLYENYEKLSERGIGNYMDKTCTRKFPTRPKKNIYH